MKVTNTSLQCRGFFLRKAIFLLSCYFKSILIPISNLIVHFIPGPDIKQLAWKSSKNHVLNPISFSWLLKMILLSCFFFFSLVELQFWYEEHLFLNTNDQCYNHFPTLHTSKNHFIFFFSFYSIFSFRSLGLKVTKSFKISCQPDWGVCGGNVFWIHTYAFFKIENRTVLSIDFIFYLFVWFDFNQAKIITWLLFTNKIFFNI